MKANYTDITIILDRSGSMDSIRSDMEGALNTFLSEQKRLPGECLVSLVMFNHIVEDSYIAVPIEAVQDIKIRPEGWTALNDAMGVSITKAGIRFAMMDESRRPEKVIFVIITDGQENKSTEFTREAVAKLVETQSTEFSWQFVYLGANQNAVQEAKHYGINAANAMTYAPIQGGVRAAAQSLSCNIGAYRSGVMGSASFSTADRDTQETFLNKLDPNK